MLTLSKEQEILMDIADMLIELYICESVQLRVEKLRNLKGEAETALQYDMMQVYVNDAADRILVSGKNAINAFTEGDEQKMMLMGMRRFTKVSPINTKNARQRIALKLIEKNNYAF